MKKSGKVLLCVASILIFLGVATAVVSGVFLVKNGAFNSIGYNKKYEKGDESMISNKTVDVANANIRNITLTGNYGKVEFVKGDRFSYEVIGSDVDSSMFTHDVNGDSWYINIKNRSGFYFFGFGKDDHISLLRITVPSTELLDNINIKLNAGSMDVERLAAKKLTMEMGAGSLEAHELVGEENLKLTVSAGKCKVDNIIGKNPVFRCEAGQINAKGILSGLGKVNCGVGQINLDVVGNRSEYDYDVSCSVGAVNVDGSQVGGIATKNSKNTGASNKFNLDCGVGQINLSFIDAAN